MGYQPRLLQIPEDARSEHSNSSMDTVVPECSQRTSQSSLLTYASRPSALHASHPAGIADTAYARTGRHKRRRGRLTCDVEHCSAKNVVVRRWVQDELGSARARKSDLCGDHFSKVLSGDLASLKFRLGENPDFLHSLGGLTLKDREWKEIGPLCEVDKCSSDGFRWTTGSSPGGGAAAEVNLCTSHATDLVHGSLLEYKASLSELFENDRKGFITNKCPGQGVGAFCPRRKVPSESVCSRCSAFSSAKVVCRGDDGCTQIAVSAMTGLCDDEDDEWDKQCMLCDDVPQPVTGENDVTPISIPEDDSAQMCFTCLSDTMADIDSDYPRVKVEADRSNKPVPASRAWFRLKEIEAARRR